jgi:hypothetical protein
LRRAAGHEVVARGEQGADHLGAGVVGVGDEDHAARERRDQLEEELDETVEQGLAPLGGGVDHALVDAGRQRDRRDEPADGAHQEREGLQGVAVDELRLGVVAGLLMQLLDAGHLLALLGHLDAVGEADDRAPDLERGEALEAQAHPQRGELGQAQRLAVEEVEQTEVGPRP